MNVCLLRRTGFVISHSKKLVSLCESLASKTTWKLHVLVNEKCSEVWSIVMQKSRGVYIAEGANERWNANYTTVSL